MNRRDLLIYLRNNGCRLERQGKKHEIWANDSTGTVSPVPRHNAIKKGTARGICDQLGIPRAAGL